MISEEDLYQQKALYLYEGKVWEILSYCPGPSVTMKCTTSKKQINFGLRGELDKEFKEIKDGLN